MIIAAIVIGIVGFTLGVFTAAVIWIDLVREIWKEHQS